MQTSPSPTLPRAERRPSVQRRAADEPGRGAPSQQALSDRVLIAVGDGASLADVIALAQRITQPDTGRVRVIHFRTWRAETRSVSDGALAGDGVFLDTREQAVDLTCALVEEFARRGIPADGLMLESPPRGLGPLIAQSARDWRAQTIVLSDRHPADAASGDIRAELSARVSCRLLVLDPA